VKVIEQRQRTLNPAGLERARPQPHPIITRGQQEPATIFEVITDCAVEQDEVRRYALAESDTIELKRTSPDAAVPARFRHPLAEPAQEATIDLVRLDPHLVTLSDLDRRAAEQHHQLAVALISVAAARRRCKRVLITSAQRGEGRTCVTLNLAAALARANRRVLVIDGDLLRPSVLRLLGVDIEIGLGEAIARSLSPRAAVTKILPSGFEVIAARAPVDGSAELLASMAWQEMLQMLEPDYDLILFDSPPLLSADAHLLKRLADTTLLVIRPGSTSVAQMDKALSLFTREEVCGVVLNRAGP
jgi:Mrp family chromosome partitioning ATPase